MSPDGPAALALLRGTHVAALLVLAGTLGFRAVVLRGAAAPGLRRIATAAAALALGLGGAWFLAEAAQLGSARSLGGAIAAVPAMLEYFGFARLLLLRLALLALALAGLAAGPAELPSGWGLAALGGLAGAALGLQPWLGHAGAAGGVAGIVLPGAELVHLAGAALWFGGLPAFAGVLRRATGAELVRAVPRFSALALAAVLAIAAGGAAEGWVLVGGIARLSGTGYGRAVLLKITLFTAALMLAAVNRLVLTSQLEGPAADLARGRLRGTVAVETVLGLAIVLAAGWLAGQPPGADLTAVALSWPWRSAGLIVLIAGAGALWFARPADPPRSPLSGVSR